MFKVRFKERLFIIFFACFLAIYPPTVKYQEVQALEWAIPTVAFDTALKFLLGLLGVSITSKALHDNVDWNQVQQDAMNYQIQKGNDAVAVGEWWEDVAKGTLNQASDCWSAFKEWVSENISVGGGADIGSAPFTTTCSFIASSVGITVSEDYDVNCCSAIKFSDEDLSSYLIIFSSPVDKMVNNLEYSYNSDAATLYITNPSSNSFAYDVYIYNSNGYFINSYKLNRGSGRGYSVGTSDVVNIFGISALGSLANYGIFQLWDILSSGTEGIFDSANDNIQDTAITTGDTTTTAIPDTIPLPWDNVSDTAEGVSDSIDALQEQVAEGVLSLEDYWEKIQEMINALAIDTATDETLPVTQNPDTGETEKIEDIANENVSNTAFTLNGLEKVFPFCIPWDIYAFVTLLVAEPVAPVINYPIYNPVTNKDINITIDFSDWETVVVLFRYILDFLLIIGLLLLARQLSGAGGDD